MQNGKVFEGQRFGAEGDVTAELVFATGMVGYLETLTDPSYHGQIVLQTFPLIGNYGVIPDDFENDEPKLSAYVVREWCQEPSNFRSMNDLAKFLKAKAIVGLSGVDTREITKILREYGVMNAAIMSVIPTDLEDFIKSLAARELSSSVWKVTCDRTHAAYPQGDLHVVLWDFGYKANMARCLAKRGCRVTVVPAGATAEEILALKPDGILLSNGPGDPAVNTDIINNIRELLDKNIPMFGICLGHQLLALAMGGTSSKLKYGHRGANQSVKDNETSSLYITSQNHGYAIDVDTLPANSKLRFVNLNDGTCEGIDYTDIRAFSVQFHPEACAGPKDTEFLFDRFIKMMRGEE